MAVDRKPLFLQLHSMGRSPIIKNETGYQAYTTKFDVEVQASQLDAILGPMTGNDAIALDKAWHELQLGLLAWRTKLQIAASDASTRLRGMLSAEMREGTMVTLLIDQSGSMRGQKMLFAAATADAIQEFLLTLGIGCEVLGFTTVRWRGGRSRQRWKWRLRPRNPGRLNDVLHIIYQSADDRRASCGKWDFRHMLRPDLPKENIDGEAILWAARRMMESSASQRHLIVLSDGAPVDDSTLAENGPDYLSDHLQAVVEDIVAGTEIRIAAMGSATGRIPSTLCPDTSKRPMTLASKCCHYWSKCCAVNEGSTRQI